MEKLVTEVKIVSPHFWRGRKVLLTGHTGFKGAWLGFWLTKLGARVTGLSLPPCGKPNLFELADIEAIVDSHFVDIRDANAVAKVVNKISPEVVFHLAAKALVRASYQEPLVTFDTNIMGTANVLNSLRGVGSVKSIVVVTTDKVYKNLECIKPYNEIDILGGHDPYSASKAASEIVIESYRNSYLSKQGIGIASARAGNVIGGGDWGEDRLIPDAIRSWDAGAHLNIRRPDAIRPWQHVLEPLNGYLVLAEKLFTNSSLSGAYNFGPEPNESASVRKVIELASVDYGCGSIVWQSDNLGPHETGTLCLETSKVREILGIEPRWNLVDAVRRTMHWYRSKKNGENIQSLCNDDIEAFTNILAK